MDIQGTGCEADIAVALDEGDQRIHQVHAGSGIMLTQRADDLFCDTPHRLAAGQFRYDLRLPCVSVGKAKPPSLRTHSILQCDPCIPIKAMENWRLCIRFTDAPAEAISGVPQS